MFSQLSFEGFCKDMAYLALLNEFNMFLLSGAPICSKNAKSTYKKE